MTNEFPKIQILLSTYNGEKYLDELIASLFNQDYPNISIKVRDDGSNDGTIQILKKFHHKIEVCFEENIGVINSFFELLKYSDNNSDYYGFCDQDDVWLPDKVSRAIKMLSPYNQNIPLMYCSNQTLVDEKLNVLKEKALNSIRPAFENSLVENIATGCTVVINKAARDCLLQEIPSNIIMHDWWFYQVISAIGEVIYDDESKIYYRQHSTNVIGSKSTFIGKWNLRIKKIFNYDFHSMTRQAKEITRIYGGRISDDKKLALNFFVNKPSNLFIRVRFSKIFRQNKLDDIIFKILISLNII